MVDRLGLAAAGYILATLHRPSTVQSDDALSAAVQILQACGALMPTVLVATPSPACASTAQISSPPWKHQEFE